MAKDIIEVEKIHHVEKASGVVKDENKMANYKHKCEKCGFEKAEIIDVGVLVSDEDNLYMLKCGKCGHSERVGRKIS